MLFSRGVAMQGVPRGSSTGPPIVQEKTFIAIAKQFEKDRITIL
jgi:hypothetical protein